MTNPTCTLPVERSAFVSGLAISAMLGSVPRPRCRRIRWLPEGSPREVYHGCVGGPGEDSGLGPAVLEPVPEGGRHRPPDLDRDDVFLARGASSTDFVDFFDRPLTASR